MVMDGVLGDDSSAEKPRKFMVNTRLNPEKRVKMSGRMKAKPRYPPH
jgi:hypothetical protein